MGRLVLHSPYGPLHSAQEPTDSPTKSVHSVDLGTTRTSVEPGPGSWDLRTGAGWRHSDRRAVCGSAVGTISSVTTEQTARASTLRAQTRDAVRRGLARAIEAGKLPDAQEAREAAVEVSRPASPEHGALATN